MLRLMKYRILSHVTLGRRRQHYQDKLIRLLHPTSPYINNARGIRYARSTWGEVVIVAGVPFSDIGGGQRSAQLARVALMAGLKVVYVYLYPTYDHQSRKYVEPDLIFPNFVHLRLQKHSPAEILSHVSQSARVIFEIPHRDALPLFEVCLRQGMDTTFELVDDWSSSLGSGWFSNDVYEQFVLKSSHVIGTAIALRNALKESGRQDAQYLPNAANEYLFDAYVARPRPKELNELPQGKTALYFGSLYGSWFDWEALRTAATENSDVNFVLIGDKPDTIDSDQKNLFFLGPKDISELPAFAQHADVCIIPFKQGRICDSVSPIKVFEYLFCGKPVITGALPEISNYPGVIVATSPHEFSQAFKRQTPRISQIDYDSFIAENSWCSRLSTLIGQVSKGRHSYTVSAIFLIHNNADIIVRAIRTLLLHASSFLHEIIIVDNQSSDGGPDIVRHNFGDRVVVLTNDRNGAASGRNLAARYATGEFLAFFDSDQWFTSNLCFFQALEALNCADTGAVGWTGGWIESIENPVGPIFCDIQSRATLCSYESDNVDYVGTGGLFIAKRIFDMTKGFDPRFDPHCFEDVDFSFSVRSLGLRLRAINLIGIRHQAHRTTQVQSPEYHALFLRNKDLLTSKWKEHSLFHRD